MTKVIGVRFRTAGKIYFFAPGKFEIKRDDHVIVETARGVEYGRVVSGPKEVNDDDVIQPLKSVIRLATEQDKKTVEKNRQKEKEAFRICLEKIRRHGLEMKLIDVEYTFDNNKILFYFTADGRIDFRELVKDLAAVFRTRIELRQIGVRDETKIRGGIGICGRPLCCSTYLTEFAAVSIKMAKEQNLSLNPTKISGVCGRLMCCLTNEEETYEVLNSQLPSVGDTVTTKDGLTGVVQSLSVLRKQVKVVVNLENDEKEIREYKADDLKFKPRKKKQKVSREEMKKLAAIAEAEYIAFAPHNPSGPVANAATLQIAACCPNFCILEIMYSDVEYRNEITDENLEYAEGKIKIGNKPGFGIELNEEECAKHPYREHNLRHYSGELTDIRPAKTKFYF